MRWIVPALCGLAMLAALTGGAVGDDVGGSAGDVSAPGTTSPPRSPSPEPTTVSGTSEPDVHTLATLRGDAAEASPLPDRDRGRILDRCLAVPEGADPSLSPDPEAVEPVASGETDGAAVVVWIGPTPQYERAVGTCIALDRGDGWTVIGRSVRRDLGPGGAALVWQPAASDRGAAAALVGRVRGGTVELMVVLDDERVLRQEPSGGFVAIPWQPVRDPARVVGVRAGDDVGYDGPLTGYADR